MTQILFIIFGAPGSGKGYTTEKLKAEILAKKLVEEGDIAYISTGDLLRKEVALATPLGKQISTIISSGQLVSDEIVDALVEKALKIEKKVVFLDGYPRTKAQLLAFTTKMVSTSYTPVLVKVSTPKEIILNRVSMRRVCKDCKSTHNSTLAKCPNCGGELIIRNDDAVIESRLLEYERNTKDLFSDLVDFVGDKWYTINNSGCISKPIQFIVEQVFENALE